MPLKYWANKLPVHSCLSSITFNYITFFSIIRYACAIVGCRSGLPHASSKTCSLRRSRVSPSRVPVFSCAHYFQVPATQATKPAAFLPRFLIIFGLVSCSDRVTKNGDDLELPISRNKGAEVTYFSFTLFRLLAVFFTVCSGLVLMLRTFLGRKFKLKGFYFPRHRQRQSNGTSGTDYLHGTAVVKRLCLNKN